MPFPVLGSNSAVAGFEIDNSLRFNDDDNAFLSRTPSSSGSRTIATVSFWVKRGNLKASGDHFMLEASSSTSPFNMTRVRFSNDLLVIDNTLNGSAANGFMFQSNREYRDPSAFYHIFFSIDVTQANATDGWLLYVNGVQQTKALSFWTQNANLEFSQSSVQMNIGRRHDNTNDNLDGYLAEYHYIDGTRKLYTDFGEFNDNGVWIPKQYTGGAYGTNGFYFKFDQSGTGTDASGIGADTSGNTNHFAVTNIDARDVCVDTPTNNFATLNPINKFASPVVTEGNLKFDSNSSSGSSMVSTIAPSNGKWYVEVKALTSTIAIGVSEVGKESFNVKGQGASRPNINYQYGGGVEIDGSIIDNEATFTSNDILGFALNLDDGELIIYKNGTALNSGTAYNLHTNTTHGNTGFSVQTHTGGGNTKASFNFGNPAFSISSGNADANGFGNFEYAVPSGYYSLCTKNLAEYG